MVDLWDSALTLPMSHVAGKVTYTGSLNQSKETRHLYGVLSAAGTHWQIPGLCLKSDACNSVQITLLLRASSASGM